MSAPITQFYRSLIDQIRVGDRYMRFDITDEQAAQLIARSEARAVASTVTALTCTHHNDQQRAACPVCLVAALAAERDQLRAEVERLGRATTNGQLNWMQESERQQARAERAEAELAAERARINDLVADLNDACITLASAKDDCDDYALLNTGFKLTAVRDVLIQYIPNAAMKEGAK